MPGPGRGDSEGTRKTEKHMLGCTQQVISLHDFARDLCDDPVYSVQFIKTSFD